MICILDVYDDHSSNPVGYSVSLVHDKKREKHFKAVGVCPFVMFCVAPMANKNEKAFDGFADSTECSKALKPCKVLKASRNKIYDISSSNFESRGADISSSIRD